jgi:hypothetical protein
MTPIEEAAGQAWESMYHHGMPAAIGLGYVEDHGCSPPEALEALLTEVCVWIGNQRPRVCSPPTATVFYDDYHAGLIGGLILAKDFASALGMRKAMAATLCDVELRHPDYAGSWLAWCELVPRAIDLCRQLVAVGRPPEAKP